MRYKIHITEEDYINFNLFNAENSRAVKKTILVIRIVMLIVFALLTAGLFVFFDYDYIVVPIISAVICAIPVFIYVIFLPKIFKSTLKKSIKRQKLDGELPFKPESEIEFSDDMIVEYSDEGELRVPYTKIKRFYVEPDRLYIYIDSARAIIVPFNALGADVNKIIGLINEKMKSNI